MLADPRLRGAEKIASKLAPMGDNASEGSRSDAGQFSAKRDSWSGAESTRAVGHCQAGMASGDRWQTCTVPVANCANPYNLNNQRIPLL